MPPFLNATISSGVSIRAIAVISLLVPSGAVTRTRTSPPGRKPSPTPNTSYTSRPVSFSDAAKVEARRGRLPLYVRRGQALLGC